MWLTEWIECVVTSRKSVLLSRLIGLELFNKDRKHKHTQFRTCRVNNYTSSFSHYEISSCHIPCMNSKFKVGICTSKGNHCHILRTRPWRTHADGEYTNRNKISNKPAEITNTVAACTEESLQCITLKERPIFLSCRRRIMCFFAWHTVSLLVSIKIHIW